MLTLLPLQTSADPSAADSVPTLATRLNVSPQVDVADTGAGVLWSRRPLSLTLRTLRGRVTP